MKASDIMSLGAATVSPDKSLVQAIRIMIDHRISALPVVDRQGRLQGIVSEGDFFSGKEASLPLNALFALDPAERRRLLASRTVDSIMSRDPVAIDVDTSIAASLECLEKHGVKRVPVTERERVVGLISRADVLRALID
ncbi:CBS domain-containing protein [Sphingopyxis chilensis]